MNRNWCDFLTRVVAGALALLNCQLLVEGSESSRLTVNDLAEQSSCELHLLTREHPRRSNLHLECSRLDQCDMNEMSIPKRLSIIDVRFKVSPKKYGTHLACH